jgi:hypothetical protein
MRSTKALSEKGFSQKSNAPRLTASTAVGTSAWPVRKMTGMVAAMPRAISKSNKARPLMPGMRTSSKQAAGLALGGLRSNWSKASALSNDSLGKWRERSNQASASRTLASSSTMYTVALDTGSIKYQRVLAAHSVDAGNVIDRQGESEYRTTRRVGLQTKDPPCCSTTVRHMLSPGPCLRRGGEETG